MTDFAERLYHRNRDPLHLVLDEADTFAPQRTDPGGQRLLGAIEDLVRRGRARRMVKDANGWSLRVLGKGRRERRVPIGDGLGQTLTEVPRGWVFPRCHRGIGPPSGHLTSAHLGKLVSDATQGGVCV